MLEPNTTSRIDLGLRLDSTQPEGRLREAKNLGQATVRIPLTTSGDVDDEVRTWLARAYDENTAPLAAEPKPPARPRPVLGTLNIVIEGTQLPGLACQPEPDGSAHRNIHVALSTKAREIAEGQPWLTVPLKPGLAVNPFPGDASETRWEVTVTVRGSADDGYEFTGSSVGGDRTDRHLGLVWGDVPGDGTHLEVRAPPAWQACLSLCSTRPVPRPAARKGPPVLIARSAALFAVAAFFEIGGAWLI